VVGLGVDDVTRSLPVAGASLEHTHGTRAGYLARRSDGARLHAGVDLHASAGTPVLAPEDGRVLVSTGVDTSVTIDGWSFSGYGPGVVVLAGESGAYHLLGHLAAGELVAGGAIVLEGAELGRAGNEGHVHWEVRSMLVPPRGASIVETTSDPEAWLAGVERLYSHELDGCPVSPTNDYRTPGPCRPGGAPAYRLDQFRRGPATRGARTPLELALELELWR